MRRSCSPACPSARPISQVLAASSSSGPATDLSVLVLVSDATAPQPRHDPGCVCPLLQLVGGQCPHPAFSSPCLGLAHPCRSAMLSGVLAVGIASTARPCTGPRPCCAAEHNTGRRTAMVPSLLLSASCLHVLCDIESVTLA
ncbi:hypothetical protein Zm00014a_027358 [Zea mays]|jgi:hypothetical protein|uniref:Uncharacterized protein n=1 Tax=Zea mays TaxID=4577 RepID=A0A3L6FUX0_MAIZE|nr:hypothetical protein Zm00014a_027358 [Zea mays]